MNIAEKAAGFAVSGDTGSEPGVDGDGEAGDRDAATATTSGSGGAWSVAVPGNASYVTEPSVVLTVSAAKAGYTAADLMRTVTVDLTAPSVSYTAPGFVEGGVEHARPSSPARPRDTDVASYAAPGLPAGA